MMEAWLPSIASVLQIAAPVIGTAVLLVLLCPWIGYTRLPSSIKSPIHVDGPISALRACLKEVWAGPETASRGYQLYSKNGQSFSLLNINFRPQVILPPNQVRWLISQPENVLSHTKAGEDADALPYILPMFDETGLHAFSKVLQNNLSRNIAETEQAVLEEMQHVLGQLLDETESWQEINLMAVLEKVIYQIVQRIYGLVTWVGVLAFLPTDNLVAACTNNLLDLAGSDPKLGYFQTLRDEAKAAFAKNKTAGQPISHALNHIDSALRESLRMNSLSSRALHRQVDCAGGIVLPDGHRVPRGTWLCLSSGDIQSDDDSFEEARSFKPFRWVSKLAESETDKGPTLPLTSGKYFVFGHGRHACPGRWYSFHVMKVVIAYLLVNYEIEPLEKRPSNTIFADINVPPMAPIIRMRKFAS
ncbi:cytochrome p450 [Hirsutella rhossiliensis]|uniref:Cytochrome p450 domain-containing protein n=1 Tax=Hirsutella rhossiliensis TaxID=111463 RepID=A0A9P8MQH1_9HYPO|nr:cytochrome p450 domain-containing protein [Hirsutella rhossiliensis]KAH0958316.1 cytochrome p450 domain-containing protein [Hirsutella rhossiliensis]